LYVEWVRSIVFIFLRHYWWFPWLQTRYYGQWLVVLDHAHRMVLQNSHSGPSGPCELWKRIFGETVARLGGNPVSLRDLDHVFRLQDIQHLVTVNASPSGQPIANRVVTCTTCYNVVGAWRQKVQDAVKALPKFSSFL
jgi:hypothetical protein